MNMLPDIQNLMDMTLFTLDIKDANIYLLKNLGYLRREIKLQYGKCMLSPPHPLNFHIDTHFKETYCIWNNAFPLSLLLYGLIFFNSVQHLHMSC